MRPARAPAPFAIRPSSSCFCREGTAREGHAAPPAAFAAPERRGDRALDRGRALCRAAARRDPADAIESRQARPTPRPASDRRRTSGRPTGEALHAAARADRTAAQARAFARTRRDRRRARSAWADPGRGASGFARLPAPFAGARREAGHHRHRQRRRRWTRSASGPTNAACSGASPRNGCASPTCARSCSASRKPDARMAGPARSMCG